MKTSTKHKMRGPTRATVAKMGAIASLTIGNKVIDGRGPAAKVSMIKARLRANRKRA